ADADRQPGAPEARVRLAAALDGAVAREIGASLLRREREVGWVDGDVAAREVVRLGAIVVEERPAARPAPGEIAAALRDGIRAEGLGLLDFGREATALRQRLAFCRETLGEPWPRVDDETLLQSLPQWLGPDLAKARRRADLARINTVAALRRLLDWRQAAELDRLAPERLAVPSGSKIRLDYSDPHAPVLAAKVQECFGWTRTPRVADGRTPVVVHLLSPAGRPAAVTSDLESFWRNGYPQVRAELRGRYPKHAWPEDPSAASPTRGTGRRRR
ncbi:MAG: ATP-dependent helicase C-terminal domain-containing protein, partial [Stackebrandtia sp.]